MRNHVNRVIACVVITVSVLVMFGAGYAGPEITLVVNPKATEISAGSEQIVITADASGKNLTFTWKLSGPGKLEDEGAAAFYIPPKKIDQKSASAIVTVTVKEPSGQETVKSVTFIILPSPTPTPTPLPAPEAKPTEKKGMSTTTKIALGVGAAAAIGGGVALVLGGGEEVEAPLGPVEVGSYIWYLGVKGQSCDEVCASHGGYHEATRFYAGSDGTDSNCGAVLGALGYPVVVSLDHMNSAGYGCCLYVYQELHIRERDMAPTTSAAASGRYSEGGYRRACACQE